MGLNANDYTNILIKLAPTGSCWPTDTDSNWVKLLSSLAEELARVDGRAVDLLNEAYPDTTNELIENWERILGLPDLFSDPAATVEERRNVILFKLQARGGQSIEYLSSLIDTLGYENEIIDVTPFAADTGKADGFLFDDTWAHYFIIFVHGDVLNKPLFEARMRSVAPAQTISIFIYDED